jgi:hypothetical protein
MKHIQDAVLKSLGVLILLIILGALLRPLLQCILALLALAVVFKILSRDS